MAVTGTPAAGAIDQCCAANTLMYPVLSPVPCEGQNILDAPVSTVNGRPLLSRMRSYRVTGGQRAVLEHQFVDRDGNPVDLRECLCLSDESSSSDSSSDVACPYTVKFKLREHLSLGLRPLPTQVEYPVEVITPAEGVVRATLPATATNTPGIYFGEMAVVGEDAAGEFILFSNTFYVNIPRGLWSARGPAGPPTLMEIRLHLRDSNAEESFLLDNVAFDDAEIALAITRPVDYWNEIPPPIRTYTTQSFPFRFHWLEGICGQLFLLAAEQHRRNNLQYSAANVSVNDFSKEPNYEKAGQFRWAAFLYFVKRKKASMNLDACWAEHGSPYGYQ